MRYTDATHFKLENGYEINGAWYPRVTKILDIKSKPALDVFFKEMESYARAEEVKNKSAAHGTLVHTAIQDMLTGGTAEVPEEIRPAIEAFDQFNQTQRIVFHKEYVERQVWSLRHRYAGTVDALATIAGKFGVLDIKTSTGFYPEYNLQTAAYTMALQEFPVKQMLALPHDIQTRWILRVDQKSICRVCDANMREKGGRIKIRASRTTPRVSCAKDQHSWNDPTGEVELKEFPYTYQDSKAFIAAKILWEWEYNYWLRHIGYAK